MALSNLEQALLVVGVVLVLYFVFCDTKPVHNFISGLRHFNMDIYANRPQYTPTARDRFNPDLVITETLAYPRSGQPFQYTQQKIQDARNPTDEQFAQTAQLFELAGKPLQVDQTINWNEYMRKSSPPSQLTPMQKFGATRQMRLFEDAPESRSVTGRQDDPRRKERTNGGVEIRHMADMDFGVGNPLVDPHLAAANIAPSYGDGQFVQVNGNAMVAGQRVGSLPISPEARQQWSTRNEQPSDIVWSPSQHNGDHQLLQSPSNAAKWNPVNIGGAMPGGPVPIDSPLARNRQGPMAVPNGGIMEPYLDTNVYNAADPMMVDGLPFDPARKMVGPGGKVFTGVAYRTPELDPHLEFLPANHPQRLAQQHYQAAFVKGNLPPTESRKFVQRIVDDVKRFRQIPWAFGGA